MTEISEFWWLFGDRFEVSLVFRKNWDIRTSLIDSFATLLYLKFLSVAYDLLLPVYVYQLPPSGNLTISRRLFYDASIPYFGREHLPYAVVAIVALAFFAVLPAMVLLLYPFRASKHVSCAMANTSHLHGFIPGLLQEWN